MQIRVSAAYGLTKPGAEPYSSEQFRQGIDVEDEFESLDDANMFAANLSNTVKLAVINQAGLSAGTDDNGVIFPVFTPRAAAAPAPAPQVTEQVATVTPIAAAPSAQPQAAAPVQQQTTQSGGGKQITWDGMQVTVYSNREKKASGEYKPNAADFNVVYPDGTKKGYWLINKNQSVNQATLALQNIFDAG